MLYFEPISVSFSTKSHRVSLSPSRLRNGESLHLLVKSALFLHLSTIGWRRRRLSRSRWKPHLRRWTHRFSRCDRGFSSTTPPLFLHLFSANSRDVSLGGSTDLLDGGEPISLSPRLTSTKRKVKQSIFVIYETLNWCMCLIVGFICDFDLFGTYDLSLVFGYVSWVLNRSPLIHFYLVFFFLCWDGSDQERVPSMFVKRIKRHQVRLRWFGRRGFGSRDINARLQVQYR